MFLFRAAANASAIALFSGPLIFLEGRLFCAFFFGFDLNFFRLGFGLLCLGALLTSTPFLASDNDLNAVISVVSPDVVMSDILYLLPTAFLA
ncbi:MAG: hypothetical protein N0E59_00015 [Candidatus Thiodiazotropha taylori]|nr:hypothetical protein [Candidatus Thiodiazotropha taylori]MCG8093875.1 hypothetical protein [Candidatus Thiodiazotropha endolucinida]MCG8105196.1 hypothetical protein [Candidatus Thiodiazotropha taylori]MCG8109131.1 hypothetical protein [Candidatus Thiodiazotropha taylori]MCW4277531.1 hypothetical protein [Candidatus Thiodiazotropha taylori]